MRRKAIPGGETGQNVNLGLAMNCWSDRRLCFHIVILTILSSGRASGQPHFSIEDMTFRPVSDAVEQAIRENDALSEFSSVEECRFVGVPVPDSPAHEQLVFVTTADGCAWGASLGPIWLVREVFYGEASVVLYQFGCSLRFLPDAVRSLYYKVEVLSGTAGWRNRTVWHFDGERYVRVSEEHKNLSRRP